MKLAHRLRNLGRRRHFKRRYDAINYFVRKFGYTHYLEIGIFEGRCFERIACKHKTGVDPAPRRVEPDWDVHEVTSDEFFATTGKKFDLVFIDGLHLAEQVVRDIYGAASVLEPGGSILLHDCSPSHEHEQIRDKDESLSIGRTWTGDTWKAFAYVRKHHPELFCRVMNFDNGIGVIVPRAPLGDIDETDAAKYFASVGWPDLETNRSELLGLIDNRSELERELEALR